MTMLRRALSPFSCFVIAALLAVPLPAAAAKLHQRAGAAPRPVVATTDIIVLPLKPMLSAGQRVCSAHTPAGLGYTMLRPATGAMPAETDYVLVNYIGYLAATGAVFDQGMQATFQVNGVIPGFSKGLQMLAKGGIARFCIPAAMGYGADGSGPIPANSDLVFQVELVDYKTAAEIDALRKASGAPPSEAAAPAQ